jgi:DNA polymerase
MGPAVFLDFPTCKGLVDAYRSVNEKIQKNWYDMQAMIPTMAEGGSDSYEFGCLEFQPGGVLMPNGLVMRYPNLQLANGEWSYETVEPRTGRKRRSKIYGGLLTENIVQSLARIVIGEHINKIAERYRVVLTVHDEIVTLIPSKGAAEHHKWIEQVCRRAPAWCADLPLDVEGGYDRVYSK